MTQLINYFDIYILGKSVRRKKIGRFTIFFKKRLDFFCKSDIITMLRPVREDNTQCGMV